MTDNSLLELYREAVKITKGRYCWLCPEPEDKSITVPGIQIHHPVRRDNWLLRHDHRNGIPLCAPHHRFAESSQGRKMVELALGDEWTDYLEPLKDKLLKPVLAERGWGIEMWMSERAIELKMVIMGISPKNNNNFEEEECEEF